LRGLYPIIDVDTLAARGLDVISVAARVLAASPALLQLRAKSATPRHTLELLTELRPLCERAGSLLFANDRPDLALIAGAHGVHVGQEDLPIAAVRKIAPRLKLGVSTHDLSQLELALSERPDYVAFGPIFATSSKQNPDPVVGLELLARARELAQTAGVPLVAIGGIGPESVGRVAQLTDLVAVISALLPEPPSLERIEARARELVRLSAALPADAGTA
jgi:thiamine-phosphate pyrophosphorylase